MALFVALVFYAIKYYSAIKEAIFSLDLNYLILALGVLLFILYISGVKWYVLMKVFNKDIKPFTFIIVFIASNLYKYIPPKGVNYVMRYTFCKKIGQELQGKISTMFAEFFSELFVAGFLFVILMFVLADYNRVALVFGLVILFCMTLFMLFPKVFSFIPIKKVKKLVLQFRRIRKTKAFLYSFLIALFVAFLHGFVFYLVLGSFGVKLGFFLTVIIYYGAHFLGLLFFAPAGLGARDVTFVGVLVLLSVDPAIALVVALIHRSMVFVSELLFGIPSILYLSKKN